MQQHSDNIEKTSKKDQASSEPKTVAAYKKQQNAQRHAYTMWHLSENNRLLPHIIWQKLHWMKQFLPKHNFLKRLTTTLRLHPRNPVQETVSNYSRPMHGIPTNQQIDLCMHGEMKIAKDYEIFLTLSAHMDKAFQETHNTGRLRAYRRFEEHYKAQLDNARNLLTFYRHHIQMKVLQAAKHTKD